MPRSLSPFERLVESRIRLDEWAGPEMADVQRWATGAAPSRVLPEHLLWFKGPEAFSYRRKIAEISEGKNARVLCAKYADQLNSRHIQLVNGGLRTAGYRIETVESF